MPDPVVKAKYFKHNDNYDDVGKISLEKVAALGNLPYLIAETPTLPAYKKDKKQIPHQLTDEWVTKRDTLLPPVNNLPDCNGSIYNLQLSLYAFMVESILGIPNAGLWLCHIDSDFVLNEYGQPKRFPDGLYHVKRNPVEKVSLFKMKYLKEEIIKILNDRRKVIAASRIQSKSLFD